MAYVVTDNCVDCRFTDCVEVCPVDCFYLDNEKNMVLIHGDECIDCGACEPACPVEAIYAGDDLPADKRHWEKTAIERIKGAGLKLITESMDPLPTADAKKANLGL